MVAIGIHSCSQKFSFKARRQLSQVGRSKKESCGLVAVSLLKKRSQAVFLGLSATEWPGKLISLFLFFLSCLRTIE